MSVYFWAVYAHVVAAVLLSGYALFWLVMALALRHRGRELDTEGTLSLIGRSRWPPFVVPEAMRIPMTWLGWILLIFMIVSGAALLHLRGVRSVQLFSSTFWSHRFGHVIAVKLALVGLFGVTHARLAARPSPRAAVFAAVLVALIACASVLL